MRKPFLTTFLPGNISRKLPPGNSKFIGKSFKHVKDHI